MVTGRAFRGRVHGYLLAGLSFGGRAVPGRAGKEYAAAAPRGSAHFLLGGDQLLVLVREIYASVLGAVSHPPGPVVPGRFFS